MIYRITNRHYHVVTILIQLAVLYRVVTCDVHCHSFNKWPLCPASEILVSFLPQIKLM